MSNRAGQILFQDTMDGKERSGWKFAPDNFVEHPEYGTVWLLKSDGDDETPWVGDQTWSNYRLEVEILCAGGEFIGLDFHVQDDGVRGCNVHFSAADRDRQEQLQAAGVWGKGNISWKLWPMSQRTAKFSKGQWIKLRLDVTETFANVYVNDDPKAVFTVFDLPFTNGGVRFWEYKGSAYFRNLRVTSLACGDVRPALEDPWEHVSSLSVVRNWTVTQLQSPEFGQVDGPEAINSTDMKWLDVESDRRGVVNLATLFPNDNTKGVVFAKTAIKSDEDTVRKAWVTYTDRLTIWCNGRKVFEGLPRGWFDPGRDESGGRLIPDQFEIELPLARGKNILLLRSQVTEPFGWGFWMRMETLSQ